VIEPTIKSRASPNKQWGADRWAAFVALARRRGVDLVQLGDQPPTLEGVRWISTPSFRAGAAVLARAIAYVGHEGGLHHAAAAVGVPAVVIFGGFISPACTGYRMHTNLFTGGTADHPLGCGMRMPCQHCETAMSEITPESVADELGRVLERGRVAA
jgi:ADP-heptose:LPS heptosyltransferase